MVIATKYTSAWRLAHESKEIQANYGGNNKKSLHVSLDASLRKLQTSYIDIVRTPDLRLPSSFTKFKLALCSYLGLHYFHTRTYACSR